MNPIKFIAFAISIFFSFFVFSQSARFKEIKLKPNPRVVTTRDSTIIYPLIITGNKTVDKLINGEVKKEMIDQDDENSDLEKDLMELIDEGLSSFSYEITYNKRGLLSFTIYQESCIGNCNSDYTYFNFDLRTGKRLKIQDLIFAEKLESFKNVVFKDKVAFLKTYKKEKLKSLESKEIDSSVYDWAMDELDECINQVSLENFFLKDKYVEIADQCYFSHAIRSEEPDYHLQYIYKSIQSFLKPRFQYLLVK